MVGKKKSRLSLLYVRSKLPKNRKRHLFSLWHVSSSRKHLQMDFFPIQYLWIHDIDCYSQHISLFCCWCSIIIETQQWIKWQMYCSGKYWTPWLFTDTGNVCQGDCITCSVCYCGGNPREQELALLLGWASEPCSGKPYLLFVLPFPLWFSVTHRSTLWFFFFFKGKAKYSISLDHSLCLRKLIRFRK